MQKRDDEGELPLRPGIDKALTGAQTWVLAEEGWRQQRVKGRLLMMAKEEKEAQFKAVRTAVCRREEQGDACNLLFFQFCGLEAHSVTIVR